MYLGGYISQDIYNAAFTYFVIFALAGSTAIVGQLVGVTYIVQLIAVVLAINFALRLSPAAAYRFAALSFAIGVVIFLAMYAAGYTATSALFWLPVVFAGLGRGALNYIPWATYNYMADVDEIVTGRRREGRFRRVKDLRAQDEPGARGDPGRAGDAGVGLRVEGDDAEPAGDRRDRRGARPRHDRDAGVRRAGVDPLPPRPRAPMRSC